MSRKSKCYPKIRGRIVELYGSQENFAESLGLSKTSVSKKLNGISNFTQKDILEWAIKLEIPMNEIGVYFFDDFFAVV